MTEPDDRSPRRPIRRRSIAAGAAWAVPVIAVSASTPAYAASGMAPTVGVGVACKLFGASLSTCPPAISEGILSGDFSTAFAFPLLVQNTTDKAVVLKPSISITNVRDGNGNPALPFIVQGTYPDYCAPIQPGQSADVLAYANSDNSANDDVYFDLTVPWGHDCGDAVHPPVFIPDLYAPAFPFCSTNVPFPTGAPTCTPPFYQP